jgi:hypothetical protein
LTSDSPSSEFRELTVVNRSILFFWAAWLSVVAATNVLDVLRTLGTLSASFPFASGNWRWINQTMDPLGVPQWLQAALFAGAIAWEIVAAVLFWRAFVAYRGRSLAQETETILACGVNLALWAAFQVLDEVFLAYQPERTHRAIFISQIATLVLLYLPPWQSRQTLDYPPHQSA